MELATAVGLAVETAPLADQEERWHDRPGLVSCPRCGRGSDEPLWRLTRLEQEATKVTWFTLCADCYRTVFKREPPEQLMRDHLEKLWRKRGLIR